MRYDDWDVILFPTGRDSRIPFKEFKVACHVVPELELAHIHGAVGVPVMTCFVPSLVAGSGFQISIHCWRRPDLSQFTRTYSKHTDLIKFEARILVDGRLVASTVLDREVNGPHLITSTCEFTKTGELERLRFPHFRRELLFQNHWRPGDDIGRIKIVISEGFPRDSLSAPIERVKNVVAFSFQHAPLELLESNAIAWPNPSMWCSVLNPVMPVPTYHQDDGPSSHTHSPGRKPLLLKNIRNQAFSALNASTPGFQTEAGSGLFGNQALQMPFLGDSNMTSADTPSYSDPFTNSGYLEWASSLMSTEPCDAWDCITQWPANTRNQRQSNSDTIMPDYVPSRKSDPMHVSGPSLEDEPLSLKVPTNTPTGGSTDDGTSSQLQMPQQSVLPSDFASSLTRSLLNQPFPLPSQHHHPCFTVADSKPSKENPQGVTGHASTALMQSVSRGDSIEARKPSRAIFGSETVNPGVTVSMPSNPPCDDIGSIMANLGCGQGGSLATPSSSGQTELSAASSGGKSGGSIRGVGKRTRNFTPASVRAIDEEDEPRRVSPHLRTVGFDAVDAALNDVAVGQ